MIVAQNGGRLSNLINTTLPFDVTCTSTNYSVECSSTEEILTLALSPCDMSLIIVITDVNRTVLVTQTLYSSPEPQRTEYMILGNEREFNTSVEVVLINDTDYFYILSIGDSSIGLELPLTSVPIVPVVCTETGTIKQIARAKCSGMKLTLQIVLQLLQVLLQLLQVLQWLYTAEYITTKLILCVCVCVCVLEADTVTTNRVTTNREIPTTLTTGIVANNS